MEDLIVYAHTLYDSPAVSHSPPLPPTPVGETVPPFTYGSKMTKVATVPPLTSSSLAAQDFTPTLPARPNNSIHPSSRNSHSPNKSKAYPEKALSLVVPDQTIDDLPSTPSPISSLSEARNSVQFPIQPDPPEEKGSDEPSNTLKS